MMTRMYKRSISVLLSTALLFTSAASPSVFALNDENDYITGDYISYGNYPQSEITDKAITDRLDSLVDENDWQSYGYYSGTAYKTASWLLRTPGYGMRDACSVSNAGAVSFGFSTYMICGICPAMRMPTVVDDNKMGDIITFGKYPQSLVTDEELISILQSDSSDWISYGYYSGSGDLNDGQMKPSDYMRYKDVDFNGERYRAVTFYAYRPINTGGTQDNNWQQDNNYYSNKTYWFKFEPIRWRVLDQETGLVVAEKTIDSQPFNNYCKHDFGDLKLGSYACDYANSSIRRWLNNDFFDIAFSEDERANIPLTQLDNRGYRRITGVYPYNDSVSTSDHVFLLSYTEVLNSNYGFNESTTASRGRVLSISDYAKCQGLITELEESSYYNGEMISSDYMKYADVEYNGIKYRAVTFEKFRPFATSVNNDSSYDPGITFQQQNGYNLSKVYWFRYDPLIWKILDPKSGLIMCSTIIDSQPFNSFIIKSTNDNKCYSDNEKTHFACDYENSSIRKWLNEDFYNTAFSDEQKDNIALTVLDNSGYANPDTYQISEEYYYSSASTTDKVYLLSYAEATTSIYGFSSDVTSEDPAKKLGVTDYAKCQGLYVYSDNDNVAWLLRSSHPATNCAYLNYAFSAGSVYHYYANRTSFGICPAIRLKTLKNDAIICHTLHFSSNGGTGAPDDVIGTGAITLSEIQPSRTDYIFKEWNTKADGTGKGYKSGEDFLLYDDTTLYAQWEEITYTLSFEANGGNNAPPEMTGSKMYTIPDIIPVNFGKNFDCWKVNGNNNSFAPGDQITINEDTKLVANWAETSFSGDCNDQMATIQYPGTVFYISFTPTADGKFAFYSTGDEDTKADLFTQDGKALINDDDGGDRSNFRIVYNLSIGNTYYLAISLCDAAKTADLTVKVRPVYTLSFDANGGIGAPAEQEKDHGKDAVVPKAEPVFSGYKFINWNTKADGTGVSYAPGDIYTPNENKTLYAIWQKIEPPVTKEPTVNIRNFTSSRTEKYKTTITFTALVSDAPAGASVHWFLNGADAGKGETFTVSKAKATYTIQAKLVGSDGKVIAESGTETVNIKSGFFAKIAAFFKMIFGRLPVFSQAIREAEARSAF